MKLLRAVVVVLFLLGIEVYGAAWIGDRLNRDQTIPEITSDREMLEVPSAYTEDMLLEGLSAYDGLDGDLTDQIVVRGLSHFQGEKGISQVSYVVFDSYNQSATFTRPVQFTDYESPRFTLTEPLVFQAGRGGRAMDRIGAEDSVDGDISSLVIQSGSDVDYGEAGEYTIHVEVTNRFGDLQTEALPVHVLEVIPTRAQLVLRTPLLYLNLGEIFDPMAYAPSMFGPAAAGDVAEITAESTVDPSLPGVYQVHYRAVESGERDEEPGEILGETWMTVIVRE